MVPRGLVPSLQETCTARAHVLPAPTESGSSSAAEAGLPTNLGPPRATDARPRVSFQRAVPSGRGLGRPLEGHCSSGSRGLRPKRDPGQCIPARARPLRSDVGTAGFRYTNVHIDNIRNSGFIFTPVLRWGAISQTFSRWGHSKEWIRPRDSYDAASEGVVVRSEK